MPDALKERALQITEALYRTTDLFSDAEPLKWSLRQTALDILNARQQDLLGLPELVKNISLKLDLASSGTFISKTNFDVIKRAYIELLSNAASLRESYKSLLDPPIAAAMRRAGNILSDKASGTISDIPLTDRPAYRSGRRGALVSALKEKGPLGVGDLTRLLVEAGSVLSEKTVQRELGALVASGAVKQDGDKRWRRYFI